MPISKQRAPQPMILCGQHHLHLAYLTDLPPPEGPGPTGRISEDTPGAVCCVLHFHDVEEHRFSNGGGNDGDYTARRLRGLQPYALHMVQDSRWRAPWKLHFLFVFHDTSFECLAGSYSFETSVSSVSDAVRNARKRVAPVHPARLV